MARINERAPTTARPPVDAQTNTQQATATSDVDGMSSVDGAEDIEEIEAMSLAAGQSVASPASAPTSALRATATVRDPNASAKLTDLNAVMQLVRDAALNMRPGETITVGGKATLGEALYISQGLEVEVTKRPDGKLDVKLSEEVGAGFGGIVKAATEGGKAKVGLGAATELTITVADTDEAAKLITQFGAAKAMDTLMPGTFAELALKYAYGEQISQQKFAFKAEAEVEAKFIEGLGYEAVNSYALVESPKGTWFLEIEGEYGGNVEALGFTSEGAMSATARIPIGVPDLTQPLPNLLAGAFDRIKDAQIEVQLGVYGDLSSSGVSVTATKSVAAKELHKLASVDGWTVGVDAYVGPREQKPGIGPGEIEITAKRSVNLSTNSDKPLPEQINDAKAIAKQAQTASSGVGARIR